MLKTLGPVILELIPVAIKSCEIVPSGPVSQEIVSFRLMRGSDSTVIWDIHTIRHWLSEFQITLPKYLITLSYEIQYHPRFQLLPIATNNECLTEWDWCFIPFNLCNRFLLVPRSHQNDLIGQNTCKHFHWSMGEGTISQNLIPEAIKFFNCSLLPYMVLESPNIGNFRHQCEISGWSSKSRYFTEPTFIWSEWGTQ